MNQKDNFITVSALNKYIKSVIESDTNLFKVLVKGEISNCKQYSSGHTYFTLKDLASQISAVLFAQTRLPLTLKNGMNVLIIGRVRVYEPNGNYQIIVENAIEDGIGELYEKFEKLKKELADGGYFDASHKRPIVKFPKKIGVVTSKSGAVIEDIKNIIRNRYPLVEIILYPSSVQGDNAIADICRQIKYANDKNEVDTLIVGRGGGSLEDLWAYNERDVAMAVYNSKIPVISAVGHETDYTICDFVADLRAETPSAAAVAATPSIIDLTNQINNDIILLKNNLKNIIESKKLSLKELEKNLLYNSPENKLKLYFERFNNSIVNLNKNYLQIIEYKENKLNNLMEKNDYSINSIIDYKNNLYLNVTKKLSSNNPINRLNLYKEKYNNLIKSLDNNYIQILNYKKALFENYCATLKGLNPLLIMDKGYSVVESKGKIVKSKNDVSIGDIIDVKLQDGTIKATVKEK